LLVLAAVGCGRIGYEIFPDTDGALPDSGVRPGPDSASGSGDGGVSNDAPTAGDAGDASGATGDDAAPGADAAVATDATGADGADAADAVAPDADAAFAGDGALGSCTGATYGGHAYAFCPTPRSFGDAATDCASKSMRLARVDDAAEDVFLGSIAFGAGSYNSPSIWPWIGASDIATPIEWQWTDGTVFWTGRNSGSAVGILYNNWASASPTDGSGTYCAVIQNTASLKWVDRGCSGAQPYLCEAY
jgi:hypothetical protein